MEPEVLITVEEDEAHRQFYLENTNRKPLIKIETPDDDDYLKVIYNTVYNDENSNINSINSLRNIDTSSSDSESDNNSNIISKIPGDKFISKKAQDICKMIERTSNTSSILKTSSILNSDNNEKSALKYFLDYFPDQMFINISNEISISTDASEIQQLFAIHILMNVLKYPRYDMYWNPLFKIPSIAERMTKERFENLRNNLTIIKNRPVVGPGHPKDNLWRIRPIVNSFTKKCQLLAAETNPCVDDQIIPFLLYLNTIKLKKQRKILRVIFSFVGLAVKNSWLEYKKDCNEQLKNPKDMMDQLEFTLKTAELLLRTGQSVNIGKRQRSSSKESVDENSGFLFNQFELMPVNKKTRISNSALIMDIRYDGIDHWPIMDRKPQRCKLENCPKKASVRCQKCNLHLCMSSNRNCFMIFHVKH